MNAITAIAAAPRQPEPGFKEGDIFDLSVPVKRWFFQFWKPRIVRWERRDFEVMEVVAGLFGPQYIYAPVGRWRRLRWWITGKQ